MKREYTPYIHKLIDAACDIDDLLNDGDTIDIKISMDEGDSISMLYRRTDGDEVSILQIAVDEDVESAQVKQCSFIGSNGLNALVHFINEIAETK